MIRLLAWLLGPGGGSTAVGLFVDILSLNRTLAFDRQAVHDPEAPPTEKPGDGSDVILYI